MSNPMNTADGKFVVIQNGQRVTETIESQRKAQEEADRRNKLNEATGQVADSKKKAVVMRNLCG